MMLKFLADKWPELLIVAILLPILGVVFSMKGDVSKLDGTVNGVVERVQHIADAIPDLRIKVAYEATETPIKTIVITGKTQVIDNRAVTPVNVFDTTNGEKAIYLVSENNASDKRGLWALGGIVWKTDDGANSFPAMERYSLDLKKAKFVPNTVNKEWSFVLYKDAALLEQELQKAGFDKIDVKKESGKAVWNWVTTVDALNSFKLSVDSKIGATP